MHALTTARQKQCEANERLRSFLTFSLVFVLNTTTKHGTEGFFRYQKDRDDIGFCLPILGSAIFEPTLIKKHYNTKTTN